MDRRTFMIQYVLNRVKKGLSLDGQSAAIEVERAWNYIDKTCPEDKCSDVPNGIGASMC